MYLDMVVTNGSIVTASGILDPSQEIGIRDGKISCIGQSLPRRPETRVLDAQGAYITPGGVDSHVHLAQKESPDGDNWETGTRGAIAGGTTTVLAFASQCRTDESLFPVLSEYHARAHDQSHCDYSFHFILTNPTPRIIDEEMRALVDEEGITSVKLYMTYEPMKLSDRAILDVMMSARQLGMTTMIHAENSDMIALITERLEQRNHTAPFYHAVSRPQIAEAEATNRAISLAELLDAPVLIVHVSSELAMNCIREAQTRLLPIHGETCPHYLLLLSERLQTNTPTFEGAKAVCSPPLRHEPADLAAIWKGVANGTFTTLSSDHAPTKFSAPSGKTLGMKDGYPVFRDIPNGLPGIETRIPLMFDQAVGPRAKISLPQFVQITSFKPAGLYGLSGIKGDIAPGYDADLVVWYPNGHDFGRGEGVGLCISADVLHHDCDYTPYEGMRLQNWPRYTILRGEVVWARDAGGLVGRRGFGRFLKRKKGGVVAGQTDRTGRGMMTGERDLWL